MARWLPVIVAASKRRSRATTCCARTAVAVRAYRAEGQAPHRTGREPRAQVSRLAERPEDLAATARADAYMNRQYLDPVYFGQAIRRSWKRSSVRRGHEWPQEDFDLIREPFDFLGVNYYTRSVTRHDEQAWPLRAAPVRQKQATYTETGWEVFPAGHGRRAEMGKGTVRQPALSTSRRTASAFYDPPVVDGERARRPASRRLSAPTPARSCERRSGQAAMSAAISRGPFWTISNGLSVFQSDSASCTWISKPSTALRRPARGSTPE